MALKIRQLKDISSPRTPPQTDSLQERQHKPVEPVGGMKEPIKTAADQSKVSKPVERAADQSKISDQSKVSKPVERTADQSKKVVSSVERPADPHQKPTKTPEKHSKIEQEKIQEVDMVFETPCREEVDIDFSNAPIKESSETHKKSVETAITIADDTDLSHLSAGASEEEYRTNELNTKIQPVVRETTKKAVTDALKSQNDKLKLEVAEVLEDEVGHRLSAYEKRRRRRDFKEKASSLIKGVLIFLVILILLGNSHIRTKTAIVFQDIGDMITSIARGDDASSNKLVEDLLKPLNATDDEEET